MTSRTVVIVDDERLARVQLTKLVQAHPRLECIGEASSGEEALEVVARLKPSVVFLDVQMPRMTGFEVLERLDHDPDVVFVTAHDEHAVRAFEVNALDFLLKPVSSERFLQTVERLFDQKLHSDPSPKVPQLEMRDRLFLTIERRPQFLRVEDLACVTAADDYSELHTVNGRSTLVPQPLYHWETRLPASHFVRIHRSALVNLDAITNLEEQANGGCLVHLKGRAEPLVMSRRFNEQLRRRFR